MTKKISIKIALLFYLSLVSLLYGNEKSYILTVKKHVLKNGFTIFLNEDHSTSKIFGAVVVKAGSKHDPKDATGIAHYLEHMLFKGTKELGTINYEKEKILLDEINTLYDEMAKEKKDSKRIKLQKKINKVSIEAAKYSIPNEFTRLVNSIGGENVNAYTSDERTVYYNFFAPNEIEKWLDIYSHRFINPVFRMFQAELEIVYQEKIQSLNSRNRTILDLFLEKFFKKHPYGQQTTLGKINHIRYPSLSKMKKFYNTYYVANNMALILSGDFNSNKVLNFVAKKFEKLKTGKIQTFPEYKEDPFKGREYYTKSLPSGSIGVNAFKTTTRNHQDTVGFYVIDYLLTNEKKTGLFDKLKLDNKIGNSWTMNWQKNDYGFYSIYYSPKSSGQNIFQAENIIMKELEKLKKGEINSDTLIIAKNNIKIKFIQSFENLKQRSEYIIDSFIGNYDWQDILNIPNKIDKITLDDIKNLSKKYFTDNFIAFHATSGGPPVRDTLKKSNIKPIAANLNANSKYAKKFLKIPSSKINPNFVKFNEDVKIVKIKDNLNLYYTKNPINNIFSLSITYGIGTYKNPLLQYSTSYMNILSPENYNKDEFNAEMEKLGCFYKFTSSEDYINIHINGDEKNLTKSIKLINSLIQRPNIDKKKYNNFIKDIREYRKYNKGNLYLAFREFIKHKKESSYLNRTDLSELYRMKPEKLIKNYQEALNHEINIKYVGSKEINKVKEIITNNFVFSDKILKSDSPNTRKYEQYKENTIFFFDHKNTRQSWIQFYVLGENFNYNDLAVINAFDKYFGTGMDSLLFQEIRELRSLAYSTNAGYYIPKKINKKGYLLGAIACQSSKTPEVVKTLIDLIKNMPEKKDLFEALKGNLINDAYCSRPNFRNLPQQVFKWIKFGYKNDPNENLIKDYQKLKFEDLINFYKKTIKEKPVIICIIGNKNDSKYSEIKKYAKFIDIKVENLF